MAEHIPPTEAELECLLGELSRQPQTLVVKDCMAVIYEIRRLRTLCGEAAERDWICDSASNPRFRKKLKDVSEGRKWAT